MRLRVCSGCAVAVALCLVGLTLSCRRAPQPPRTAAEFERATAGMTRTETARYILDTYKCGACHTVDPRGNMGYTAKGEQARELTACCKSGTMCVRLLTAASTLATVPDQDRSEDERKMLRAFDEYGCSFCHRIEAGTTAFTDIGPNLGFMHQGCVEIENAIKKTVE